jgi:hypothetical protein
MERISIKFGGGRLVIKDERGARVDATRATVFLVEGNDIPVALLDVEGTKKEVGVTAFEMTGAVPVLADHETFDEVAAPKKGGKA